MSIKICKQCGTADRYKNGRCKCCVKNRNEAYRRLHEVPVKSPKKIKQPKDKKELSVEKPEESYYSKNKEKILLAYIVKKEYVAQYYIDNKERISSVSLVWRRNNKETRNLSRANRRALKKEIGGKLSKGLATKLFKLQKGKCACCKLPLGDNFHMDHIYPTSKGGSNVDSNIQLLCATCNLQKNAKHPIDFMRSRGFLC